MPLFSIVMPTRNRASLLEYALRSAMGQRFDDYEIVVSNNCSDDETDQIVQRLADSRVRYFRTDRVLAMPDSWDFALSKTRGDWVTVLCDDDAICPRLLETVAGVIAGSDLSIVSWAHAIYTHNDFYEPESVNKLTYHYWREPVVRRESRSELNKLFSYSGDFGLPKMLNSFCHRKVIDKVIRQAGRFFIPLAPDYSSCAAMLAVVREYAYIGMPLMVTGIARSGGGGFYSYVRGDSPFTFFEEFGKKEQDIFRHVPLRLRVGVNSVAETLLNVKEALPEALSGVELNWYSYFIYCYEELSNLKRQGFNISALKEHFLGVLEEQPLGLRTRVRAYILKGPLRTYNIRTVLRHIIAARPGLTYLESLIRRKVVAGENAGFHDILGAAQYLDRVMSKVD
jgi:glycosyltransferase involved in cell wall biosynthesis